MEQFLCRNKFLCRDNFYAGKCENGTISTQEHVKMGQFICRKIWKWDNFYTFENGTISLEKNVKMGQFPRRKMWKWDNFYTGKCENGTIAMQEKVKILTQKEEDFDFDFIGFGCVCTRSTLQPPPQDSSMTEQNFTSWFF